jgi:single-strand DNA-binding protein
MPRPRRPRHCHRPAAPARNETAEGEKRTVYEVEVDDAGPSLRYATARVTKVARDRVPHPADAAHDGGWGTPPTTAAAGENRPPF